MEHEERPERCSRIKKNKEPKNIINATRRTFGIKIETPEYKSERQKNEKKVSVQNIA